jgi:hypothetical protein
MSSSNSFTAINISEMIETLSFDEYVLLDCLKFDKKRETNSFYSILHNIDFVALTEQGIYSMKL